MASQKPSASASFGSGVPSHKQVVAEYASFMVQGSISSQAVPIKASSKPSQISSLSQTPSASVSSNVPSHKQFVVYSSLIVHGSKSSQAVPINVSSNIGQTSAVSQMPSASASLRSGVPSHKHDVAEYMSFIVQGSISSQAVPIKASSKP